MIKQYDELENLKDEDRLKCILGEKTNGGILADIFVASCHNLTLKGTFDTFLGIRC